MKKTETTPQNPEYEYWTNALGMKFRLVPKGSFTMGSPHGESRRFADEVLHQVELTHSFYLGIYLTTQAEWKAVLGDNPSKDVFPKRAPVVSVSWFDCMRYIEILNKDEYALELKSFLGSEWQYSLPTEAQWEYACRAGTQTAFYFGDAPIKDAGNFGKNVSEVAKTSNIGSHNTTLRTITEVGSFPPNPWGFYDMCGNVCEWTLDGYQEYDLEDTVNPIGKNFLAERVARGGSWRSLSDNCRSACRFNFLPTYRGDNCGLRVAIVKRNNTNQ